MADHHTGQQLADQVEVEILQEGEIIDMVIEHQQVAEEQVAKDAEQVAKETENGENGREGPPKISALESLFYRSNEAVDSNIISGVPDDELPIGAEQLEESPTLGSFLVHLGKYYLLLIRFAALPVLVALLYTSSWGFVSRMRLNAYYESGEDIVGLSLRNLADRASFVPVGISLTESLQTFIFPSSVLLSVSLCCWWQFRPAIRIARVNVIYSVFSLIVQIMKPLVYRNVDPDRAATLDRVIVIVEVIIICAFYFFFLTRVGRATQNPRLGWVFGTLLAFLGVNYTAYRTFLPRLMARSDASKLVFAGLVMPIWGQLLMVMPSRVIARSLQNNHPVTSWLIAGFALTWEKIFCRIIICSISDFKFVAAASLMIAVGTGIMKLLAGTDEFRIYKCLHRFRSSHAKTQDEDPLMQTKHPHNRFIHTHCMIGDLAIDCALIVCCSAWILAYNVMLEKDTPVVPGYVIASCFMQLAGKLLTNLCVIVFFTFKKKMDFIALAKCQARYGWVPVLQYAFMGAALLCSSFFPQLMCVPEDRKDGFWIMCSKLI